MSVIKSSTATVIESAEQPMSITKPEGSILDACVSTRNPNAGSVKVLLTGIPVHKIAEARDWVRLHPDEAKYWSKEYCFVNVPAPGARETMHFIAESLVAQYGIANVQRFRLALASKPGDAFFLCRVPSQNLDNLFNKASVEACQKAKKLWTQAVRREDGQDGHQVKYSEDPDAFPEPKWPDDPLLKIIEATFAGRIILTDDNPALLRLRGVRQTGE